MNQNSGFAVFFFPQALEILGVAIKPYLQDGPAGVHVLCNEIDTGGALIEMTIEGRGPDGKAVDLELMVPTSMVRMIVSLHSDGATFGFTPREALPEVELSPVGSPRVSGDALAQALPAPVDTPVSKPPKA
jgi:hypothetical protein